MPTPIETGLSLGDVLQIYYTDGIRNQISRDYKDWEFIKRERVSDVTARSINFLIQTSLGHAAIQRRDPGLSNQAFPAPQAVSSSEHSARIKEISATIELPYNLWKRAQMSKEARYTEPLEVEMSSKLDALKRQLSLELHLDGTGVIGQIDDAAPQAAAENGAIRFNLEEANTARGHVGAFQFNDFLILREPDGTASALAINGTVVPDFYSVVERDFDNETVLLQPLDATFTPITVATVDTQPTSGDVFYRFAQPTIPDLTAPIADYGNVTEVMAGLPSLTAADGRIVHGLTMQGATAGTRVTSAAATLASDDFEKVLNQLKINVGSGAYAWKQALLAPKRYSELVNIRDEDRRFNAREDLTQGTKAWTFMHRNDTVALESSEFCKNDLVYIMPEAKQSQGKVLQYHGTDFMPVAAPNGDKFHLKASGATAGGYLNTIVSYMDGYGVMINKHPAAVGVIVIAN